MRPLTTKIKPVKGVNKLQNITFRGFGGGLLTQQSDLLGDPRYLREAFNVRRTASGSQIVRWGSQWLSDVTSQVTGTFVDAIYFANSIIGVMDSGEIVALDGDGVAVAIWNASIAGMAGAWSSGLDSIDFVPFKGKLVIHNGIDKPLVVDQALNVAYLADEGTGSNTHTPIGKFGCVVSNYNCVAGIDAEPTSIYVSSRGTIGTFFGDTAPNDGIIIDVGAYAPEGAPEIRGIAGYRSTLIVFFATQAVPITLGVYDDSGNHTPTFPDVLSSFGLISHRTIVSVEKDLWFASYDGICSVQRNIVSGLTDTDSLSDEIEPTYRAYITQITDDDIRKRCFGYFDRLTHDVVFTLSDLGSFVCSYNPRVPRKYKSWSNYGSVSAVCAAVSLLGRVYFMDSSRVYQQGNAIFAGENYYADRQKDREAPWTTGHSYSVGDKAGDDPSGDSYICIRAHVSGGTTFEQDRTDQVLNPAWELYLGEPISFNMELPWIDGKDPMRTKMIRYISIATKGTAVFTIKAWVDNLFIDYDGVVRHDPALEMQFIGNDARGFGTDVGPYGGGRRSNDPRLFKFPLQFKNVKFAIVGADRAPLEIGALSFLYAKGKFTR